MPCDCPSKNMTGSLVTGFLMGGAIFLIDTILRPQFATGGMELLLFLLEGVACDFIYGAIEKTNTSGSFGGNISLMKSITAGLTIWLTDIFLRPENFTGLGTETIKFFLQGFIVMLVLQYKPA